MQGGNATLLKKEREAFPQKGEQTERADHPVDGSPERFCGPRRQQARLSLDVNRAARRDLR